MPTPLLWKPRPADPDQATRIAREHRLTRPIAMVLANRGIPCADVGGFLEPRLRDLSDPYRLHGMEVAAARLWQAVRGGEAVVVHGDYDADGITATVLLTSVLRANGARASSFLPNRFDDGYGFTAESVAKAVSHGERLLVTVDCGIGGHAAAAWARAHGVDVVITDHHQPGPTAPDALAVINPKLQSDADDLHLLAGVGVAFKLCHAFLKYGREHGLGGQDCDLRESLDLVAVGTVADVVPLLGENRVLVRHGLKELSYQRRPGIRALCDTVGLDDALRPEDIAFRIAPRLNAAGRLGSAGDALDLLEAPGIVEAYTLAQGLDTVNRQRQQFEERAFAGAEEQVGALDLSQRYSLVTKGRQWHRGVIGIVASRLTQAYHRPSIVLSIDDSGEVFGSGRSVDGIDLVQTLGACREWLLRYGGHPMASGLALDVGQIPAFEQAFEQAVRAAAGDRFDFSPSVTYEGDATLGELGEQFFEELELLQPFGHGHQAPCFRFRHLQPSRVTLAGRGHTRGSVQDEVGHVLPFILFGRRPEDLPPGPWSVLAVPGLNRFRGEVFPQLQVQDVRSAE